MHIHLSDLTNNRLYILKQTLILLHTHTHSYIGTHTHTHNHTHTHTHLNMHMKVLVVQLHLQILLHLVWDPPRHRLVAFKLAKDSLAFIHPATSEYVFFHFAAILAARFCMKHSASRPKTPSTDTTSGVNDAHRMLLLHHCISSSADDRTEATSLFEYK